MVEIVRGKIQNQNTDIIVNSSNADLLWEETTMNGDIHIKAGSEFTKACQKYIKENGSLNVCDIVPISEVGELECKEVWNVLSPWWDYYDEYIELYMTLLDNLIRKKFKESEFSSISIPMIGCGAFMLPEDFVVRNIVEYTYYTSNIFDYSPNKEYRIVTYNDKQYELANSVLKSIR